MTIYSNLKGQDSTICVGRFWPLSKQSKIINWPMFI